MTDCNIIQDLLPLYLDNACSAESRELVEEHLEQCAACRKQKEMMKRTIEFADDFIAQNLREEKLLEERYRTQLDDYAQALERLLKKKVKEKIIYSFTLQKEIPVKDLSSIS